MRETLPSEISSPDQNLQSSMNIPFQSGIICSLCFSKADFDESWQVLPDTRRNFSLICCIVPLTNTKIHICWPRTLHSALAPAQLILEIDVRAAWNRIACSCRGSASQQLLNLTVESPSRLLKYPSNQTSSRGHVTSPDSCKCCCCGVDGRWGDSKGHVSCGGRCPGSCTLPRWLPVSLLSGG